MAICRCKHHAPPIGIKYNYSSFAKPLGYPNTSSICGREDCEEPGAIFLRDDEVISFNSNNQRIFGYATTHEVQVKVEKDIYPISDINREL